MEVKHRGYMLTKRIEEQETLTEQLEEEKKKGFKSGIYLALDK